MRRPGAVIDFEVRSVNDDVPAFEMIFYGPGDVELARADKAGSLESDGRFYPLIALHA